jgi:hypothetical protein
VCCGCLLRRIKELCTQTVCCSCAAAWLTSSRPPHGVVSGNGRGARKKRFIRRGGGLPVRGVKTILQRWSVLQINCAAGYASSHPAVRSGRDADTEPWPAIHAPELKPLKPLPVLLLSLLAGVLQPMLYSISSVDLTQSPPQRAFFVQKKTSGAY